MVYTAMTNGATGFLPFAYHNLVDHPDIKGMSPENYTDLWEQAKQVNHELDVLKPYILSSTPGFSIQSIQKKIHYIAMTPFNACLNTGMAIMF